MTTNTKHTAPSAYARLTRVHPHHAHRILAATLEQQPGTIHTFKVVGHTSAGSFFTGIKHGDRVVVTAKEEARQSARLAAPEDEQGAHLSLNGGHCLTVVPVEDWTLEETKAAQRAADTSAQELLTLAAHRRKQDWFTADEILDLIDRSNEAKDLAFALGVYVDYFERPEYGMTRRNGQWY